MQKVSELQKELNSKTSQKYEHGSTHTEEALNSLEKQCQITGINYFITRITLTIRVLKMLQSHYKLILTLTLKSFNFR